MLHEYNHGGDERQPRKREHTSVPVFSQGPLLRLGRGASGIGGPALQHHPEHPHRLSDVFDLLRAEVLVAECQLAPNFIVHLSGDADAARLGETLQPCRDVDPVAVDLLAIHHHVAEVDPNAKLHSAVGWQICVLRLERGLDLNRALDGIHDAGELGQYAVARRVHESSTVLLDQRIDQLTRRGQTTEGRLLVLPHEAAIAEDIGAEYGGELPFHAPTPS